MRFDVQKGLESLIERGTMLLLTDRPAMVQELKRLMWAVEPCIIVLLGKTVDARGHSLILVDLSLSSGSEIDLARTMLSAFLSVNRIPVLYLSRKNEDEARIQAYYISANAFLPRTASQAQVLAAAKEMIRVAQLERESSRAAEYTCLKKDLDEVSVALKGLFDASRRGVSIRSEDLDRGTFAIIAAVAGRQTKLWLDVVREHDDSTYQHCLLVTGLVAAFSAGLGMTPKSQRHIVAAALLHDIGKTKISLEILNKKGRLTKTETDIIRTHPVLGYNMLLQQGIDDDQILDVVRHHHEYLDGSGYPDALKKDDISPQVRIVTICDIYGALIERRSYKEPMSSRDAIDILMNMKHKLDSGLLASFVSYLND